MIIDVHYFIDRIGTDRERRNDRRFCAALSLWHWRHKWREAEAAGDYAAMDRLDRSYEMIHAL